MKKSAIHNTRTPDRGFDGFNDPLVKIMLGVGIVLTLMLCIVALLTSSVGVEFLGLLKPVMWLLGAYAVVGAICGLVRSIQWRTGAAARRAPASGR